MNNRHKKIGNLGVGSFALIWFVTGIMSSEHDNHLPFIVFALTAISAYLIYKNY